MASAVRTSMVTVSRGTNTLVKTRLTSCSILRRSSAVGCCIWSSYGRRMYASKSRVAT